MVYIQNCIIILTESVDALQLGCGNIMTQTQKHPYIAAVLDSASVQFFLVAERKICTCERFSDVIVSPIAVYFTFDIVYL